MPEGDTVHRVAAHLHRALAGRVLTRADLRVPKLAAVQLAGERVDEVVAVGKHLLHRIGPFTLHTHLGMDGEWQVLRPGARWPSPAHRARVVLANERVETVGFDLPVVELVPREREGELVGYLGPDLLGPSWNADEAVRRLAAAPEREIADALLDQRTLAGLGNEYVNELCFLRGLDPRTPVARSGDLAALVDLAHRLIVANRDRVERTTTGDLRRGRRSFVYDREGLACLRCGTRIVRDRHGGVGSGLGAGSTSRGSDESRVSYRCPVCQPPPGP
ncbi:Fpg/Nei family DNA glycosylase [Pseudoclavibacter chungangensis]|uniref:DNA-(apurinic or apyrimidinic site) lyase n=1 Tax=Pseudoclavibacter chungangensis TaxID=587635 RepID=A0A7J5C1Z8_9MICO|nr:DNA-formamidopyrimidine glycosylase family protein [Pseudoclavibacter chungangensis]KAB1662190.1 Fpg/Nei family DNA glycosylase [Pseudoclavibacter chungangensis]NYJ65380.1 endonuclease-8 [Pseudoclavibacter chungangensis]